MMPLSPTLKKFILHWGEMGSSWGVNRSVAQIHALLYGLGQPLNAEDISEALSMARSNVSTSLRELQGWGVIRIVHKMGDRRDHYESLSDVWEMFRIVLAERRKREIEPTMRILRECVEELNAESGGGARDKSTRDRLAAMLEFFETTDAWYLQVNRLPKDLLTKFFRLGGRLKLPKLAKSRS
jgi:DNA-binding transcriptional regulator GbsR (MarR family)